jgi:hypothetical protein
MKQPQKANLTAIENSLYISPKIQTKTACIQQSTRSRTDFNRLETYKVVIYRATVVPSAKYLFELKAALLLCRPSC